MPRDLYSPQADAEPGYCPGFWYHVSTGQVAAGSALSAPNNLRFLPFQIRALVDIVALGGRITTLAAAGNCAFAIYRAHAVTLLPNGLPVASTAGNISTTLAVNVNGPLLEGRARLTPGLYNFGVMADNTTVAFQTVLSGLNSWLVGASLQDKISFSATSVLSHRGYIAPFPVWPDLTDPALMTNEAQNSLGQALGQFQVAP